MSLQETSFEYENVLWVCEFLPYRIIVCVDAIQYIVQKREQNMYRNLSFFTEFYAIARQYPQLAMNGLPSETFGLLSHEIRRRINRAEGSCTDDCSYFDQLHKSDQMQMSFLSYL